MNRAELTPDGTSVPPLLQACSACGGIIDISDQEPLAPMTCPICGASERVSGQVAQFELQEVVGRGGMGVVYRAYDASLDRFVALKLLRRDKSTNSDVISQLETEAAITASINHPHVVRVFTTGVDYGRFFIAMELVDKGTLDDLIKLQGKVGETQVLEVGIQIAQGLRAAQQHGLIHRDVKPGNILFSDAHTAKIVDFGLAIFMEDEEKVRGEIWGTPYYVAPEKLDQQPEDFRSDMYSLGGTLFHAIAGRPPFEAEDASMVALKHLKSQAVSLQAFAPRVSGETAYVINRTLLKNPDERYQSYDELIEHLEYALNRLRNRAKQPVAVKRVVLEDDNQQKAMGWLTIAMVAVILLAAVGGFAFRKQIFRKEAGLSAKELAAGPFPDARRKLIEGDPAAAVEIYRKGSANAKQPPVTLAWAQIGEGIALFSAGQGSEARAVFQKLADTPPASTSKEMQPTIKFLSDLARRAASDKPVAPKDAGKYNKANYESVAPFVLGLQNWSLGKMTEGTELLQNFQQTAPAGNSNWISDLKTLAANYLEERSAFELAAQRLKVANNTDQKLTAVIALQKLKPPFESKAKALIDPIRNELQTYQSKFLENLKPGNYRLVNRRNTRVLEVDGSRTEDNTPVVLSSYTISANQQWALTPLGGGQFKLLAVNSNKALTSTPTGEIKQMPWDDRAEQRWRFEPVGDGFCKIMSGSVDRVLTVTGSATVNNARVALTPYREADDQQWQVFALDPSFGGWKSDDLGQASPAGVISRDAPTGRIVIKAGGTDLGGNADNGTFLHKPLNGDGEVITRVVQLEAPDGGAKAGLMIRASLDPGAPNVSLVATPGANLLQQVRAVAGQGTQNLKQTGLGLALWIKLVRRGEEIAGYRSTDGRNWTQITRQTIPGLPANLEAGLAVTAHSGTTIATFDGLSSSTVKK